MNIKIENAKKQIKRILISEDDIQDAGNYAYQLLKHEYHNPEYLDRIEDPKEDFLNSDDYENMRALTTALIVSYSRPFTRNEGNDSAIPSLPNKFLSNYNALEMDLHNKILNLRNRAFAHSDAELFNIELSKSKYDGMIYPVFLEYPIEFFTKDELKLFQEMIEKLLPAFRNQINAILRHHGDDAMKFLVND